MVWYGRCAILVAGLTHVEGAVGKEIAAVPVGCVVDEGPSKSRAVSEGQHAIALCRAAQNRTAQSSEVHKTEYGCGCKIDCDFDIDIESTASMYAFQCTQSIRLLPLTLGST